MNAVEIEQAITDLSEQPFDRVNFPYAFLEAFGNKETTIKRLRAGASNKSDLGGVLQTGNIHILTCDPGRVSETLKTLNGSPATVRAKARFVLATDGIDFEAEDLAGGETVEGVSELRIDVGPGYRVFHPPRSSVNRPVGGRQQTHADRRHQSRAAVGARLVGVADEEENCDRPVRCGRASQNP